MRVLKKHCKKGILGVLLLYVLLQRVLNAIDVFIELLDFLVEVLNVYPFVLLRNRIELFANVAKILFDE